MIDSLATIQNLGSNPRSTPEASDDSKSSATLQMEDFLQLLTSQISNQDPLEPMKDTEFISQMANIASLEQMQQFTKGFESFASSQKDMVAQAYLGRIVTISDQGNEVEGLVDSVEKSSDGSITIADPAAPDQPPAEVGRIKLATWEGSPVSKGLDGLFRVEGGGILPGDEAATVKVGALEQSNVKTTEVLVDMIDAQRLFAMRSKLISTAREIDESGAQLMRLG